MILKDILKDKETGDILEVEVKRVNDSYLNDETIESVCGEKISLKSLAKYYEDAPEEIKPFEEVVRKKYICQIECAHLEYSEETIGATRRTNYVKELEIADIDYYEILPDGTMKTKFTWGEAMEIEKKTDGKWRVPTQAEWFAITAAFGKNEAGEVTGETLAKNLNLTTDENGYGYYWSSTPSSYANARGLYFSSTGVYPQSGYNKTDGFTVRCVAR